MAELFVHSGSIRLWTESFGDPKNPAMLLIMGAGAQGIFWPDRLCHLLADNGFFVIRYDNRDTGQSSSTNFSLRTSYTLNDMADDALTILDAYGIKKAYIVGASMGGTIAQLLTLKHPERVLGLILIMSTPDLSAIAKAVCPLLLRPFVGLGVGRSRLPQPKKDVISFYRSMIFSPPKNRNAWMDMMIKAWHVFSGGTPVDEEEIRELEEKAFARACSTSSMINHARVIMASSKKKIDLTAIEKPTLIIHGEHDPVFPIEHGKELADTIAHAKLVIIPQMGHLIPRRLSDSLAETITAYVKRNVGN